MCSHVAVDPSGFVALTGGRGGKTLEARPVRKDADHARASPHRHVVVPDTVGGRHLFVRMIDPHRIDNPDGAAQNSLTNWDAAPRRRSAAFATRPALAYAACGMIRRQPLCAMALTA